MSLEAKIEALTDAVNRNNTLLETAIAKAAANKAAAAPATSTQAPEKAAEKAAEKPAEAKTESKGPGRPKGATNKPKALGVEDVRKVAAEFLGVSDAAVKADRKEFMKALNAEFGVDRVTDVPEGERARAIDLLTRKMAGEDVSFGEDGGDEPADDDESLI